MAKTIFVEKMGTGIKRINDAMNFSKLPKPNFEFYEYSFYVTLFDKTFLENILGKDTIRDTTKLLSKNEKIVLKEIKKNPQITAEKLSYLLNINIRNTKNNIAKLKQKKLLKRVGSAKSGHWEIIE